jgi:hypothetical protein
MGASGSIMFLTTTTSFTQGPEWSAFTVAIPLNNGGTALDFMAADLSALGIGQYVKTVSGAVQSIAFKSTSNYTANSPGAISLTTPNLMYGRYDGSTVTDYLNGTAGTGTATSGTPNSGSETLGIGATNRSAGGSPALGVWGDVLLGKSNWDANLRQCIEGYEAWKYGIASILPAGHPYKSAAPTISSNCS